MGVLGLKVHTTASYRFWGSDLRSPRLYCELFTSRAISSALCLFFITKPPPQLFLESFLIDLGTLQRLVSSGGSWSQYVTTVPNYVCQRMNCRPQHPQGGVLSKGRKGLNWSLATLLCKGELPSAPCVMPWPLPHQTFLK